MIYIDYYDSPLGKITLASDSEYLCGLWFENQKYYMANIKEETVFEELAIFKETKAWLDIYFSGEEPAFIPPIKQRGTDFSKLVGEILLDIPYGKTTTYKEIADEVAKRKGLKSMSSQAVGQAVGHNPISIIIPCHRVVGSNQHLTGYAGGLDKKIALLQLEGIDISELK